MGSIIGDEISEHSSACHKKKSCKILWVLIMPGVTVVKPERGLRPPEVHSTSRLGRGAKRL